MRVKVIKEHTTSFPDPIQIKKGDVVRVGKVDDEFPEWIWVTTKENLQGWAPIQYLELNKTNSNAVALQDYNATELNTEKGEILTVLQEINQWFWVSNPNGLNGWVPVRTVCNSEHNPI